MIINTTIHLTNTFRHQLQVTKCLMISILFFIFSLFTDSQKNQKLPLLGGTDYSIVLVVGGEPKK